MIRAFFKLSLRDRVVVLAVAIGAVAAVVVCIFRAMSGVSIGFTGFPESILQKDGSLQVYHRYEYSYFPTSIQFPGTDYGLDVGGAEIPATSNGAAFKFSDDMYIVVANMKNVPDTASYVKERFFKIIGGNENMPSGEYAIKIHDTGYLNTLPVVYDGGILTAGEDKLYVLTYRVSIGTEQFLLAYATPSKNSLRSCFYYLNHMLCTLCMYDDGQTGEQSDGVRVVATDKGNTVQVDTPTIELMGERDYESFDDVKNAIEQDRYKLENPDARSIYESIIIGSDLRDKTVAVAFEYVNGLNRPSLASIESPSGEVFEPYYFNDDNDGRIVFLLKEPEQGTWKVTVSDDVNMGDYAIHVMDYIDYVEVTGTGNTTEYDAAGENTDPVTVTHSDNEGVAESDIGTVDE